MHWTIRDLWVALKKELELRKEIARAAGTNKEVKKKLFSSQKATASAFLTETVDSKCQFCLGKHAAKDCEKVKTTKERKNSLRKYSRCFKCLGKGHRADTCPINISCEKCDKSHNPALCEGGMGSGGMLVL